MSPGCDNCYALTMAKRLKGMGSAHYQRDGDPATSGPGFGMSMHPDALEWPLRKTKPMRVFVNSMSDLFHSEVTRDFQAQVFAVMALAPQHTFQVLTKRPGVMRSALSSEAFEVAVMMHAATILADLPRSYGPGPVDFPEWPLPNVWVGTSVEDQKRADLRIPALLDTPAAVRFLSCEPLLGQVDLGAVLWDDRGMPVRGLHWVIVGGESGPGARPMHPDWARLLRDQCQDAGVAHLFKQWGNWVPYDDPAGDADSNTLVPVHAQFHQWPGGSFSVRLPKKAAGRMLDGRTWDEFPQAVTA